MLAVRGSNSAEELALQTILAAETGQLHDFAGAQDAFVHESHYQLPGVASASL